jgi:hypothetical protein
MKCQGEISIDKIKAKWTVCKRLNLSALNFYYFAQRLGVCFALGIGTAFLSPRYAVSPKPISWLIGKEPSVKYTPCCVQVLILNFLSFVFK